MAHFLPSRMLNPQAVPVERVQTFKERSLAATAYPFVLADAMVIKVRQDPAVRPMSLLIAVGINAEGRREVLGSAVAAQESQSSGNALFSQLQSRGGTLRSRLRRRPRGPNSGKVSRSCRAFGV